MADSRKKDSEPGGDAGAASAPLVDGVPDVFVESEDEGGSIRISETVITSVVRKHTLAVPGVVAFAGETFVEGLADIFRRRPHVGGIAVSDMQGESVSIAVTLVLEFGVVIPEVARRVQHAIREAMQDLTGKRVAKVDVTVVDLSEVSTGGES